MRVVISKVNNVKSRWRRGAAGANRAEGKSIFQARMNNTLEWSMEKGKRSLCAGRVAVTVTIKVPLLWVRAV